MKRQYWIIILCSVLCFIFVATWSESDSQLNNKNVSNYITVSQQNGNFSSESERGKVNKIARDKNHTVQQVEDQITQAIINIKTLAKSKSGDRDPGIYFISDGKKKIDVNKVIVVPIGGTINFKELLSKERGYITSSEKFSNPSKDMYIDPLDISRSPLGEADFVGYSFGGVYLKGNEYAQTPKLREIEQTPSGKTGWTTLTRVFSDDNLGYILLEESDYTAAGITALIPQSAINAEVGGYPATLLRVQDRSGQTISSLTWLDKSGLSYSLKINQIDDASVTSLTRLAKSLVQHRP